MLQRDRKDRSWAHHHWSGRSMRPLLAGMKAVQLVKHGKDSCKCCRRLAERSGMVAP